jgi:hypothetical protein
VKTLFGGMANEADQKYFTPSCKRGIFCAPGVHFTLPDIDGGNAIIMSGKQSQRYITQ